MTFQISQIPLEQLNLKDGFRNPSVGGFAAFEGWVRDHNEGRRVRFLEYEVFEPLAEAEAQKIFREARERFAIMDIRCVHRAGRLDVGEMAVWVGATAAHRDAAFKACRYVIDEIKRRLPIWKKEYYTDGESEWVGCGHCGGHIAGNIRESELYSRQTILAQVGVDGQEKLKSSKVLIVGAGGLGSPVLMYLASAGVGTLGICESDKLESNNLHRQTLYSHEDIGQPKAQLAARRIGSLNPFIKVCLHEERLSADNAETIAAGYDVIVDCTDNFETKFLLNDLSVLHRKALIQASIYQFEGQIRVYDPERPSACLRCLWPETPREGCVGACADVGVLGVVPAVLGSLQALETLKLLLGLPGLIDQETLLVDLNTHTMQKIRQPFNPQCPLCGDDPGITDLRSPRRPAADNIEIDPRDLSPQHFEEYLLIDVREGVERMLQPVRRETIHLPLSHFASAGLQKDKKYLLFCAQGVRSRHAVQRLRDEGFSNVFFFAGSPSEINAYLNKHPSLITHPG
jgi:adenylyltransferase/sulfurtransferase